MREERQKELDAGALPDFLPETKHVRDGDWKVAPIPADLQDRRVEITGPVDRKMIINALNSGAHVFMADFEDATSPTWENLVEGQVNLKDRWQGKIDFTDPASGKEYKLSAKPAVLLVRPRGWHLPEEHVVVDGQPMSGSLFDFGLYFFTNAKAAMAKGSGPYFYLPKMESHLEARLWNEVFVHAEEALGVPAGTIKATVLIETLPAAFEMDEIIYELRDHMAGLNCGRWDYIFSFIKTLRNKPEFLLPDRGQVDMGRAFLKAYSQLLIKTCHRRGAFAMGGMAAQIPDRKNPEINEAAFQKVRADKEREAKAGHDGTWVAHPDLVPVATEIFDKFMPAPNQLGQNARGCLRRPEGPARSSFRHAHRAGRCATTSASASSISRRGCAGAAPSRSTTSWKTPPPPRSAARRSGSSCTSRRRSRAARRSTAALFEKFLGEEMEKVKAEIGAKNYAAGRFPEAIELFRTLSTAEDAFAVPHPAGLPPDRLIGAVSGRGAASPPSR